MGLLELELIQSHMAKKPVLRGEVATSTSVSRGGSYAAGSNGAPRRGGCPSREGSPRVVSNCHRLKGSRFGKWLAGPGACSEAPRRALGACQRLNPRLQALLTVSPVRHWRDGAAHNSRSKVDCGGLCGEGAGEHAGGGGGGGGGGSSSKDGCRHGSSGGPALGDGVAAGGDDPRPTQPPFHYFNICWPCSLLAARCRRLFPAGNRSCGVTAFKVRLGAAGGAGRARPIRTRTLKESGPTSRRCSNEQYSPKSPKLEAVAFARWRISTWLPAARAVL